MTLVRAISVAVAFVALVSAAAWGEDAVLYPRVEWLPDGAVVTFPRPTRVLRIEVWEDRDNETTRSPLLSESLHDRPISRHRLFYLHGRDEYETFLVIPRHSNEQWEIGPGLPPIGVSPEANVTLEAPYTGQADVTCRWGWGREETTAFVAPDSEFVAAVAVFMPRGSLDAVLALYLPEGIRPAVHLRGWDLEFRGDRLRLSRKFPSAAPGEVVQFLIPLKVSAREGEELELSVMASTLLTLEELRGPIRVDPGWHIVRRARLRVGSVEKMSRLVPAEGVVMPTDARGERDVRRQRDTILVPSRLGTALRRALGLADPYADYYAPVTFLRFSCAGAADVDLSVAVSMRVVHAEDDTPAAGFRPPDYLGGGEGTTTVAAELKAGRHNSVVLPIYARTGELLPGRYRTRLEVRLLGTDTLLLRHEHPFQVRVTDLRALLVTALAVVASIAGLVVFLARQRRLFGSFRISELVLIALFATMTFVLVIFPGSILGPVFSAVAGPFGFLFQGVFFEVLRVLVMVTLLVLVPRVGTVTLLHLVRYLIGGLVLGGFTPVDLFYFGSSVVLLEGLLYAAGVTSTGGPLGRRDVSLRTFLVVALVVGLANAATQYVIYCLNISFYRLYFAGWFIWLCVVVNGFLYAVLGAIPGLRLGLALRRISE